MKTIKAITLWQPWATFIALGFKIHETRSWATDYRGPLAIHAAKRRMDFEEELLLIKLSKAFPASNINTKQIDYPLGVVVCTCELKSCEQMNEDSWMDTSKSDFHMGDWTPGRFAWKLGNVRKLEPPVPAKGYQGLWTWKGGENEEHRQP